MASRGCTAGRHLRGRNEHRVAGAVVDHRRVGEHPRARRFTAHHHGDSARRGQAHDSQQVVELHVLEGAQRDVALPARGTVRSQDGEPDVGRVGGDVHQPHVGAEPGGAAGGVGEANQADVLALTEAGRLGEGRRVLAVGALGEPIVGAAGDGQLPGDRHDAQRRAAGEAKGVADRPALLQGERAGGRSHGAGVAGVELHPEGGLPVTGIDHLQVGAPCRAARPLQVGGADHPGWLGGDAVHRLRQELTLAPGGLLSAETARRTGQAAGVDLLLAGSYVVEGEGEAARIRPDLALQEAGQGEPLSILAASRPLGELLALVDEAGAGLREALGLPPLTAPELEALVALLPASPEAARRARQHGLLLAARRAETLLASL